MNIKKTNEKYPLIVWSGGLDSTALVLDALHNKESFYTMYINLGNNKEKSKMEREARQKIIELFIGGAYGVRLEDIIVEQPSVLTSYAIFKQTLIWLAGIVAALDSKKISEVRMGYVEYDSFWHIKTEFVNAYESLYKLCHPELEIIPLLKFPLEWKTKEEIVKKYYLDKELGKLLDMVWVCEDPKNKKMPFKACKKCSPCRHFHQAIEYNK